MDYKINVGDKVPNFTAFDLDDMEYSDQDLEGGVSVIYFYPKDSSPGCTKQACSFRDNMIKLEDLGVIILGVSPDGKASHQEFMEKNKLNFSLLCDENLDLCRKFDVVRDKEIGGEIKPAVERTTFVINPNGIITWIERPVNVEGHVERVIEAARKAV